MIRQYELEKLNQIAEQELATSREHSTALRDWVEEILGDYYDELYEYFYDVITAPYDFKVITARRCLVLFQIFCHIFNLEENTPERRGRLISDWAIVKYRKYFSGKKVLIIDDILIHGRRVGTVYDTIEKYMDTGTLDIRVYMMTDGIKCPPPEGFSRVQYTAYAHDWGWKNLSDRIVKAIYVSNTPYTSFVGAYAITEISDKFQRGCTEADRIDNSNCWQQNEQCRSQVFFCNREEPDLFRVFTYINCVRVYTSERIKMMTLIPYSFTKALKKETMNDCFKKIAEKLSNWPAIREDLLTEENTDVWNKYRIRLFDAVISHFYGLHFFHDKFQPENFDYDTLSKSFDEDIADEFRNMRYEDIRPVLEASYADMVQYICNDFCENEMLQGIYDEQLTDGFDKRGYRDYLTRNREIDEERARARKKRLRGISIDYIFRNVADLKCRRLIAADILNSMDDGCASAAYDVSEDEASYASFIAPGEQSFRIILEKYPQIIRQMVSLEEKKQDVEQYIQYLRDNNLIKENEKQELEQFYRKNKNYLINWNILSILENRDLWTIKDLVQWNQKYLDIIFD